jgi:hypothetical protein
MMPLVNWSIAFLPGNIQELLDFEPEPSAAQSPAQEKKMDDKEIDPGQTSGKSGSRRQEEAGATG